MIFDFYFEVDKHIGLNNSYIITTRGKFPTRTKKKQTRLYEANVESQLLREKKAIENFNKHYDEKIHYLTSDITFFTTHLFTKKNLINKKSGDYDGLIKIPQDCLFKLLNADDSQVIAASQFKIQSKVNAVKIVLTVKDLASIQI